MARTLSLTLGGVGLAVLPVSDLDASSQLCASGAVDAVLMDEGIAPKAADRGVRACRQVVAAAAEAPVPVMVLVRELATASDLEALYEAGAWGVAPFPLGGQTWVPQLATWVRGSRDVRVRRGDGLLDPATGLYSDRGLLQRAREVDAAARRSGGPIACAVIKMRSGAAADRAGGAANARDLAHRIADACRGAGRASDVFGRLDGDQFGVIAPGADASGMARLIDRISAGLDKERDTKRSIRVGVCAVPDMSAATLSVADMLTHAASRA